MLNDFVKLYANTYAKLYKVASGKAFIMYKVSNATKITIIFVFLYEIYFLLAHFYFKCNLKNPA